MAPPDRRFGIHFYFSGDRSVWPRRRQPGSWLSPVL